MAQRLWVLAQELWVPFGVGGVGAVGVGAVGAVGGGVVGAIGVGVVGARSKHCSKPTCRVLKAGRAPRRSLLPSPRNSIGPCSAHCLFCPCWFCPSRNSTGASAASSSCGEPTLLFLAVAVMAIATEIE
jgi:hypothetical protein